LQTEQIFKKDPSLQGTIRVFPGMVHGFAIRGDESREDIKKAVKEAYDLSVEWWTKHL